MQEFYVSIERFSTLSLELGGLWRRPYGILIAGIWTSLAEKMADIAEKLAQTFTQS